MHIGDFTFLGPYSAASLPNAYGIVVSFRDQSPVCVEVIQWPNQMRFYGPVDKFYFLKWPNSCCNDDIYRARDHVKEVLGL